MRTIINPLTGRKIIVGGPTYTKLFEELGNKNMLIKLANAAKEGRPELPVKRKNLKTRNIKKSIERQHTIYEIRKLKKEKLGIDSNCRKYLE